MTASEIRTKLIEAGVKNLHEFGYPGCDTANILTDDIYAAFFLGMLRDNKGHRKDVDAVIDALITEIKP